MHKTNTIKLITTAFLMALEIILTRFLSLFMPFLRMGLGFLPISVIAILYGPLWAGSAYALGDFLGMIIYPSGPYFPGFTLTAFLTGLVYGFVLYKKPITWKRLFLASCIVCIFLNLILDTFWLYILLDKGFLAILPARLFKCAIMIPAQPILIHFLWHRVLNKIKLT